MSGPTRVEIERVKDLTPERFRSEYQARARPVVIEQAGAAWEELWTPAAVREKFGDREILVESRDGGLADRRPLTPVQVSEFVDAVESDKCTLTLRGAASGLFRYLPEMLQAFLDDDCFYPYSQHHSSVENLSLWMQPKGNLSYLHIDDENDNLHTIVHGKKKFILAPPSNFGNYYHYGWRASEVNPFDPDLTRYPRFADVTLFETTLGPGDMVFIPGYWWHSVHAETVCISVNKWYPPAMRVIDQIKQTPMSDKAMMLMMHYLYRGRLGLYLARAYDFVKPREKSSPPTTVEAAGQ